MTLRDTSNTEPTFISGRTLLSDFAVKYKPVVGNYDHFMPQMQEDIVTMLDEYVKAPTAPQDSGEPKVCPWCHGKFVPKDADEALVGGHKICPVEGSGDGVEALPEDLFWKLRIATIEALRKRGIEDGVINACLRDIMPIYLEAHKAAIELLVIESKIELLRDLEIHNDGTVYSAKQDKWLPAGEYISTKIAELEALQSNQKGQV